MLRRRPASRVACHWRAAHTAETSEKRRRGSRMKRGVSGLARMGSPAFWKRNSAAHSLLMPGMGARTPRRTGGRPRRTAAASSRRAAAAGPGAGPAPSAGGRPPRAPAPRRPPPPECPRCGPCACRARLHWPQNSCVRQQTAVSCKTELLRYSFLVQQSDASRSAGVHSCSIQALNCRSSHRR